MKEVLSRLIKKRHLRIIVYLAAIMIFGRELFIGLYPRISLLFLDKAQLSEIAVEKKSIGKTLDYLYSQNQDPKIIKISKIQRVEWPDESLGTSDIVKYSDKGNISGYQITISADNEILTVHTDSSLRTVYLLKGGKKVA